MSPNRCRFLRTISSANFFSSLRLRRLVPFLLVALAVLAGSSRIPGFIEFAQQQADKVSGANQGQTTSPQKPAR